MDSSGDSAVESDISDITDITRICATKQKEIINGWNEGKGLREIARDTGLSIKDVKRILKQKQKTFIEKGS